MNWFQRKQEVSERRPETSFLPKVTTISAVDEKTGELKRMMLTRELFERAIDEVENDPLAGHGILTKREELVNKLVKLARTCDLPEQVAPNSSAPLLSEPKTPAPRSIRAVPTSSSRSATAPIPTVPSTPTPANPTLNLTNEAKD